MARNWVIKLSRSHRRRCGLYKTEAAAADWWTSGGAPTPWAAYQPKCASSLAASYTDLSGNGNNASVGVAPTWDATNGWKFNGTTQYLTTTFVAANDQSQSMIVQFTTRTNDSYICGAIEGLNEYFVLSGDHYVSNVVRYGNGGLLGVAPGLAAGNLAVAGNQGYRNGAPEGGALTAWGGSFNDPVYIGALNNNGAPSSHSAVYIQALAIYDVTLTAGQVLAVATAMAAL